MPTNRPFFSNFLAAFRAQPAFQKAATSTTTSATATSTTQASFSQTSATTATSTLAAAANASGARALSTKATSQTAANGTSGKAIQAQPFQPTRQHAPSPYSRSPGSPGSPGYHTPIGGAASRQRRGSDSSSEGFRDALGNEKWYIGGRAPNGEEKYYKLSMAKRPRSVDRLSMDRLSL